MHFDGRKWNAIDTGVGDELLGLWGSADGMLYFYGASAFGRWNGHAIELFATAPIAPNGIRFTGIWGNSATEVFLGAVRFGWPGFAGYGHGRSLSRIMARR